MSALEQFRADPEGAIEGTDFFVDWSGFSITTLGNQHAQGGSCTVFEQGMENGVHRLKVVNGGTDYFFPWVNRGVGEVTVPRQSPDRTLVLTGGMNGCGLVATSNGGDLVFYHDADANRLGTIVHPIGTQIVKIEPRIYMPTERGARIVGATTVGQAYSHQLLTVRHNGQWKIFNCGVITGPGLRLPIVQAYKDGIVKFVTAFS